MRCGHTFKYIFGCLSQDLNFWRMQSTRPGSTTPVSKLVKYLGVQTDNLFSPSAQCTEAANRARRLIIMIRRSFQDLSKSAFIPLYGASVRPQIEYCMPACSPNLVAGINHLERIQRLATRLVTGMRHLRYEERLQLLGLHSLQWDDFGMTSLPPSRYSRAFWILIRTCFSFLPLDAA